MVAGEKKWMMVGALYAVRMVGGMQQEQKIVIFAHTARNVQNFNEADNKPFQAMPIGKPELNVVPLRRKL